MYRYILFDLDGTLTDSKEGIVNSVRWTLRKMDAPVPEEEILQLFIGPPLQDSFERFCGFSPERASEAVAVFRQRYLPVGQFENRAAPGAAELLARLKAAGVKMCVASSTHPALIDLCLRRLEVRDCFEFLLSCEEVGEGKNRPTVYLEAARRLGGRPENTVIFEDILVAAQTAKQAGFSLGVIYDVNSDDEQPQLKALADCYITRWDDPALSDWLYL